MARYHAELDTPLPQRQVFAYLSDFSNSEQWDPGVVSAEQTGDEGVAEGTRFRLVASFLGREVPLDYRVDEFRPPRSVLFVGENATAVSRDRITVERHRDRTRITYDADLSFKGVLRVFDPLLGLAFRRVGDRALAGLRRTLDGPLPAELDAAA